MERSQFDGLIRELSHRRTSITDLPGGLAGLCVLPSRRDVLRGLATMGLGLGLAVVPGLAEAKPKRRKQPKRPKPAKPNAYGCLEVNDPCRKATQCCSGICTGKPGKKRCRAHGAGSCPQNTPGACTAPFVDVPALKCEAGCFCYGTTAGSNFCSSGVYNDQRNCTTCKRDADCVALGFPPGSACAPIPKIGICAGFCDSGRACLAPCGTEIPAPEPLEGGDLRPHKR
jgi:hypothetical protein